MDSPQQITSNAFFSSEFVIKQYKANDTEHHWSYYGDCRFQVNLRSNTLITQLIHIKGIRSSAYSHFCACIWCMCVCGDHTIIDCCEQLIINHLSGIMPERSFETFTTVKTIKFRVLIGISEKGTFKRLLFDLTSNRESFFFLYLKAKNLQHHKQIPWKMCRYQSIFVCSHVLNHHLFSGTITKWTISWAKRTYSIWTNTGKKKMWEYFANRNNIS